MGEWSHRWRGKPRPLGLRGENLAADYLRAQGYRILNQNARLGRYEIDIIAQEGDTIAFVEVKTRRTAENFLPEDNVGPKKMEHLRRAASIYQARVDDPSLYFRFDVVSIVLCPDKPPEFTLYRDAFR